jgi:hypothetical protein
MTGWSWPLVVLALTQTAYLPNQGLALRGEEEFDRGVELKNDADKARTHFRAAALCFEELRQRGVRNALLYRNLGNAYLLADDLPRAILAYRSGLQLSPADQALRDNLALARDRVVYPEDSALGRPPADPRPPWLPRLGGRWVFSLALGFYVLA